MENSLKQIKLRLVDLLGYTNWVAGNSTTPSGHPSKRISGLKKARFFVYGLEKLRLFEASVNRLKASAVFTTGDDELNLRADEGLLILNDLNLLKVLTEEFLLALTRTVPSEDNNSVNIKLPETKDFDELSKVSRELHKALTQPILNDEINGEARIVSVENGSIWFNVFVGASALPVIASIAWSAAVVYKKFQEGLVAAEHVRSLRIKNDMLEQIKDAQKAEIDLVIKAEAEYIGSNHFKNATPEQIERIKASVSIFADLIQKGGEIHPALAAPENVSNLFPDMKNLLGLESKIKKIANE